MGFGLHHTRGSLTVAIVCPVFDDWDALLKLIGAISSLYSDREFKFQIVVVDDGSLTSGPDFSAIKFTLECIESIHLVRLALNLGHQRAIATGLCFLEKHIKADFVVVMDSDGEDRPEDIQSLISESLRDPGTIVYARRTKRSEGVVFRAGYFAFKMLFRALTGQQIDFGNYSVVPFKLLSRLVRMPELWNNLPAAILRSGVRLVGVPTNRGTRYSGKSKMNFTKLILHGLSALSVYTDLIFTRILLGSGIAAILAFAGILLATYIRLFTSQAIPGWATLVVGDLFIFVVQITGLVLVAMLMVLGGRSQRPIVPTTDSVSYIAEHKTWRAQEPTEAHSLDLGHSS